MGPNIKIAEKITFLAALDPASVAAGTVLTSWVPMNVADSLLALINVGVFGASATVDAKLRQAMDNTGANAKDITGKAIVQMLAAGGNGKQVTIECRDTDLDVNNGYAFVALSVTVGTAATFLSASLIGGNPMYIPTAPYNAASVVQQV